MERLTPIDQWQLRRLSIFADMLRAIVAGIVDAASSAAGDDIAGLKERLAEFDDFLADATAERIDDVAAANSSWLEKLEDLETDILAHAFSELENDAVEMIHASCRAEGARWGREAAESKGDASNDARKALLVLNDFLVDGLPADDNIEVVSSEARQITYNLNRCSYVERFDDTPQLAWLLCTSRQAWKDGFFESLGGIAHQLVRAKCQGDDRCMYIITLCD
jgi:hypothetical protein